MTDRTMTDPSADLSHLDLDQPDKTFLDSNELVINMGPQHPATHGVLRVILKLDGEKVLGTECVIGYLHRGVEKIAEHRTYTMFNPYVDRMDYVAAVSNGLGYCEAVEKLLNIEAPPRAKYIRVKIMIADGESVPSAVPIWATANWLEREVFDMFGIRFDGHPDLKRILLPDGWKGYPLRKDYGIIQQDQEWVRANLGIESGQ